MTPDGPGAELPSALVAGELEAHQEELGSGIGPEAPDPGGDPDPPERPGATVAGRTRATGNGTAARRASRWAVALVVGAAYLPAVWSVGLRTDVGGHLKFAEQANLTGHEFSPYNLFEQLTTVVRTFVPFGLLSRLVPELGHRATIWEVAGVATIVITVVVLSQLVFTRILRSTGGTSNRNAFVAGLASIGLMLAAPVTVFTWAGQQLLVGYVGISSFENPTVNIARPFAFVLFVVLADRLFVRGNSSRTVALAAAMSVLVLAAKPSYTICLIPALAIVLVTSRRSRGQPDWRLVTLGFLVPSAVVLSVQYLSVDGGGSFGFAPFEVVGDLLGARGRPVWTFPLFLVLSVLFPLVVAVLFHRSVLESFRLGFAWVTFGVGVVYYCLLRIEGRVDYGDFVWGAQIALLMLFVESACLVLRETSGRGRRAAVCATAFSLHVLCGVFLLYHEITDPAQWW